MAARVVLRFEEVLESLRLIRGLLAALPAGEYFVQGMILPYTKFSRADGHTIWAHMDSWEGQRFNDAPGALVSAVQKVRVDASTTDVICAARTPRDAGRLPKNIGESLLMRPERMRRMAGW